MVVIMVSTLVIGVPFCVRFCVVLIRTSLDTSQTMVSKAAALQRLPFVSQHLATTLGSG